MLAPTQSALAHDHPVPMLRAEPLQILQVFHFRATGPNEPLHLRARIDEVRPQRHVSVKIVPGEATAALLNLTENDSPSCSVRAEA